MTFDLKLVSVYEDFSVSTAILLFDLLKERTREQSISHKTMPSFEQHVAFIQSRPYGDHWYLVHVHRVGFVGAVYLTGQREIGVAILKKRQDNGYGSWAVKALMASHGGQVLANINPQNAASIAMFSKLGFTHLQSTYAHE